MAIAARLYNDARWAERHRTELAATLRDPDWAPADVVVEDLSRSGFRITAPVALEPGDPIGLGLGGLGIRKARVVRISEGRIGGEFLQPLSEAELQAALDAVPFEPIAFPVEPQVPSRNRLIAVGVGLSAALVAGLLWTGWALISG